MLLLLDYLLPPEPYDFSFHLEIQKGPHTHVDDVHDISSVSENII